jgi:hypothetical protein
MIAFSPKAAFFSLIRSRAAIDILQKHALRGAFAWVV